MTESIRRRMSAAALALVMACSLLASTASPAAAACETNVYTSISSTIPGVTYDGMWGGVSSSYDTTWRCADVNYRYVSRSDWYGAQYFNTSNNSWSDANKGKLWYSAGHKPWSSTYEIIVGVSDGVWVRGWAQDRAQTASIQFAM